METDKALREAFKSMFSLNMNPCWTRSAHSWPKASAVSLDMDALLLLTYDLQAFSTTCHCPRGHLFLWTCHLLYFLHLFHVFYVTMETKFNLCYVINWLVCWWLMTEEGKGNDEMLLSGTVTDNLKISISAFLKKLSGKHIQFAENTFYKANIIKNIYARI